MSSIVAASQPPQDIVQALRNTAGVVAAFLAVFSWVSPNHYLPWASFHAQLAAAVATGILAALVLSDRTRGSNRWPWLAFVAIGLAVVPWLQYATGLLAYSGDAWVVCTYLAGVALALHIGHRVAVTRGFDLFIERGALLVLAGAMLSMGLTLYQWFWLSYLGPFVIDLPAPATRAVSNFAQPNNLALALTLGALAGAALYERRRIGGPLVLALLLLFGVGVVMTQSRAALVIWVTLGLALAFWSRRAALVRITVPKIALGMVCAGCAYLIWPSLLEFRVGVAGESDARSLASMASSGMRPLHWAAMVDAIGRTPWFGYGWNQVVAAQYLVAPDHPATGELLGDSHNLVLDMLLHNGVPLGAAICLALGYWLMRQLASVRTSSQAMALSAVLVTVMASMVEFPLNYTFFLLPTCLLMGALTSQASWDKAVELPRWFPSMLLACLVALTAAISREYLHVETDVRSLRFEQQRIGRPVARTFAQDGKVLTHFAAFLALADAPRGRSNLPDQELAAVRSVAMRFPNWSLLSYYAGELALNGHDKEAAAVLTRICRTQTVAECELAGVRWQSWGRSEERISRIPFPPAPKPLE